MYKKVLHLYCSDPKNDYKQLSLLVYHFATFIWFESKNQRKRHITFFHLKSRRSFSKILFLIPGTDRIPRRGNFKKESSFGEIRLLTVKNVRLAKIYVPQYQLEPAPSSRSQSASIVVTLPVAVLPLNAFGATLKNDNSNNSI
jgi:hypothetical protein